MSMELDVEGKLRATKLPINHGLLPLFDAVMNSIQSLEETNVVNKKIEIVIERDGIEIAKNLNSISTFKIRDNGVGFTEENFKSFKTSYSPHKLAKGCKGVGRFLWLKAFEDVSIRSVFLENSVNKKRQFRFVSSKLGIEDHTSDISSEILGTEVILGCFKAEYSAKNSFNFLEISGKIVEHFIDFFANETDISFELIDNENRVDLNAQFNNYLKKNSSLNLLKINGNEFRVLHLKAYGKSFEQGNLSSNIALCANKRSVSQVPLSDYLQFASVKLFDEEQSQPFYSRTFVSGIYLDSIVNNERTKLEFPDQQESLFSTFVDKKDLLNEVSKVVNGILAPFVASVLLENKNKIKNHIYSKSPEFRPLLKYVPNIEELIRPDLQDNQLDLELYKLHSKEVVETKKQASQILASISSDTYRERLTHYLERQADFSKATLAQYVTHRKVILDLFQMNLSPDQSGVFPLEETLHSIIFQQNQTSDDSDFKGDIESHNLWIVDERLAFHNSLSSDQPLSINQTLESASKLRPDILIFDNPLAFSDSKTDHSSIVIIEFKRPGRALSDNEKDDPIKQVINYIKKIRHGKARTLNNLEFSVADNTPFFCYIVCDLSIGKIRDMVRDTYPWFRPTRGNDGYFGFHENLNAYMEVIGFSKLIGDSIKRNAAIFKKLGLSY